MEITLLGTGCPVVHTERYGPAQVVRHGVHALIVAMLPFWAFCWAFCIPTATASMAVPESY
jgi:hypothetical protein